MKRLALTLALLVVVAACGDDDTGDASDTTAAATQTTAVATTAAAAETTTTAAAETTTTAAAETTTTAAAAETTTTAAAAETTTTAAATTTAPSGGANFEITSVSFGAPMVIITNSGDVTGNLGGHFLCQRPSYVGIPDVELAPGESVAISLGGDVFLPPPGALTIDGQLSLGGISADGGEIGLYSTDAFSSAEAIVSYVEWGNSGHGRSGTAVEAGIWDDGGFVPTIGETAAIQLTSFDTTGSTAWSDF